MKKSYAIAVIAVISVIAVAFAQQQAGQYSPTVVYPYSSDFPDILVMKGVAVKGEDVKSAVFVATDAEDKYKFKSNYLLLDGESHELELESSRFDESTKTAILRFDADGKAFKLVIKMHRFNYQDIATASGVFNGHILNLRFVGDYEQIYRIMQYEKSGVSMPVPLAEVKTQSAESELTKEEIAAIEEAIK